MLELQNPVTSHCGTGAELLMPINGFCPSLQLWEEMGTHTCGSAQRGVAREHKGMAAVQAAAIAPDNFM